MNSDVIQKLIAMIIYMLAVIGIGLFFAKKANKNAENYFLGGRSLGPWVSAFSAEASDMSGWLLMGLPGLAYWTGLADAGWTAIGLFIGTYLNWLIVSKRLRRYSVRLDAITIPEFFSKRFHEKKKIILTIASLFIIIFFTVYTGQCFASCGKLFTQLFGLDYHVMMIIAAVFVLFYTFLGGFLAESASDFMQGVVMIVALVVMFVLAIVNAGGIGAVVDNAKAIPGFASLFTTTVHEESGTLSSAPFATVGIVSALAWGLGYFGMPQVLLRFMGIRSEKELTRSRRVACIWLFISMFAALMIGIVGRSVAGVGFTSGAEAETIFIKMADSFLPPILAGLACAGILAASISSSDSYLLISTSAIAENVYHGIFKKDASDKQVLWVSRIAMAVISIISIVIAWDRDSTIFSITSFAWAGFGATFGPLLLFSLFWKRTTTPGAICGMIVGGAMVFIWNLLIKPLGGVFGVYELLPAFILSSIVIVVVSLLTGEPSAEIEEDFEAAKSKS